jgi:hypothetical protein
MTIQFTVLIKVRLKIVALGWLPHCIGFFSMQIHQCFVSSVRGQLFNYPVSG